MRHSTSKLHIPRAINDRPESGDEQELSYRGWLGDAGWLRLAPEVRQRFSRSTAIVVYVGTMLVTHNRMGWLLGMLCRLIGTPLATGRGAEVPLRVEVRPNRRGGMLWSRYYGFKPGRWQRVRSTKRLNRGHGLEEVVSGVLCMALKLQERRGGLVFTSRRYSIALGRWRLPIPHWLTPGETVVTHEPIDALHFRFTLRVTHRWLGELIWQDGVFRNEADLA